MRQALSNDNRPGASLFLPDGGRLPARGMTPVIHIRRWMGWWRADTYTREGDVLRLEAVTLGTAADAESAALLAFRAAGVEPRPDSLDVFSEPGDDVEGYLVVEPDHESGFFPCKKVPDAHLESLGKPNHVRRR